MYDYNESGSERSAEALYSFAPGDLPSAPFYIVTFTAALKQSKGRRLPHNMP